MTIARGTSPGSALIAIIAAILLFSVLAAALLPMVGSSGRQSVLSHLSDQAYLLAESGYRLVQSRYRQNGSAALHDLDERRFSLTSPPGMFEINIFSYFYEYDETVDGFRAPGKAGTEPVVGALVRIRDHNHTVQSIGNGGVTFTVSDQPIDLSPGTAAYPMVFSQSEQNIINGGNLSYQNDGTMFPEHHGQILVGYRTLTYLYNNRIENRFEFLRDPKDPHMVYNVPADTPIFLTNYARVESTGIVGSGEVESRRTVNFYGALPLSTDISDTQFTFEETFESAESWTEAVGTLAVDSDRQVLTLMPDAVTGEALALLTHEGVAEAMDAASSYSGGFLSYDAQVKIGYDTDAFPEDTAAGLSFRLSNGGSVMNGYGISLVRNNPETEFNPGFLPPDLDDTPTLVLWQQASSRTWLAYKKAETVLLETGFEADDEVVFEPSGCMAPRTEHARSPIYSYGCEALNLPTNGILASAPIAIPHEGYSLSFYSLYTQNAPDVVLTIDAIDGDEASVTTLQLSAQTAGMWHLTEIDLPPFTGNEIQLVFTYSTETEDQGGWYIDDLKIAYPWPLQDATVLVRLAEASLLRFDSGSSPATIEKGDWVSAHPNNGAAVARGQVIQAPILSGGRWEDDNAEGVLLLNRTTGDFSACNSNACLIRTWGKPATASVVSHDDRKNNVIRIYMGQADSSGTSAINGLEIGNTDRLDDVMIGYPRRETSQRLIWPVNEGDEWTSERDFFRLVQWDAINSGPDLEAIPSQNFPNTIIRSHQEELQSPELESSSLIQSELGLHAFGAGAASVYFDDFGLRLVFPLREPFATPLQQ